VALAGDEMADGDEGGNARLALAGGTAWLREVGAEVYYAGVGSAIAARELGDSVAIGEHGGGGGEVAFHRLASRGGAGCGVEHVAAVDRHHERYTETCAAAGISRGDRVVGVDEVELERVA
jgi:hypothetical protein